MKIEISKISLLRMLNMVSDTITNYSSESSLKEIIIVAGNDKLYVMGKYLDLTITVNTDCDVLEVGTILVESESLTNVIEDTDDEYITIKSLAHNFINISSINTNLDLLTKDITTYPATNIKNRTCCENC